MDRCGQCRVGRARRAVCAGEELERSQQRIGLLSLLLALSLRSQWVLVQIGRNLDVAAILVRCQVFRRFRGWFRPWLLVQLQKVCCLLSPLGRIEGTEPELRGCCRHPT